MFPKTRPFYHPFENSTFIGFWITKEQQNFNLPGSIIDSVDLYYQPVQQPTIGTIFFGLKFTIILIGEMINSRLLNMMYQESSVINEVTKLYLFNQMISYPVSLVFITVTDFIHPANEVIGRWFCTLGWICIAFCGYITIFYSFFIALIRYFFILHPDQVEDYGKEKVKKIFKLLMIVIPILCVLWEATEEVALFSYINKCYGTDHKVFLMETSTLDVLANKFWTLENGKHGEWLSSFILFSKRVSKLLKDVVLIVMGCNLSEAFIYFKVIRHIHRYFYVHFTVVVINDYNNVFSEIKLK